MKSVIGARTPESPDAPATIYSEDLIVATAREFLEALQTGELFRPRGYFDATSPGAAGYVFRGQSNSAWNLLPKVHRRADSLSMFTEDMPAVPD
jgi:hypothetical protein